MLPLLFIPTPFLWFTETRNPGYLYSLPPFQSPCKCLFVPLHYGPRIVSQYISPGWFQNRGAQEPADGGAGLPDQPLGLSLLCTDRFDSFGNLLTPCASVSSCHLSCTFNACHIQSWWGLREIKYAKCLEECLACNKCPKLYGMGPQAILFGYLRNNDLRRHGDLTKVKLQIFVFYHLGTI